MTITSKLGFLMTIFMNIYCGLGHIRTTSCMKKLSQAAVSIRQLKSPSSSSSSVYDAASVSHEHISRRMFFALRSTQIDDTTSENNLIHDIPKKKIENTDSSVSRADYEFLDCGDLKRLERFAGKI